MKTRVPGFCFACVCDVSDPRRHYSSRTHQDNAGRWDRREARRRRGLPTYAEIEPREPNDDD